MIDLLLANMSGEWIQKIREHESQQNRAPIEDVINRWISSDKNLYRWLDGKIKIFLLCAG